MADARNNVDLRVIRGFGQEWSTFKQDQGHLLPDQRAQIFNDYFGIFPWQRLPPDGGVGIDVGCGTGRWATLVAPRVRHLHLLDASPQALAVARQNLNAVKNVSYHLNSVAEIALPSNSLDFAYSLGVLHHVPDCSAAIKAIGEKLKPGAPLLIYLYYAFDNRPAWYRALWRASDVARLVISHLPHPPRVAVSFTVATFIYWPLASIARATRRLGMTAKSLPLSYYSDKSFYVMRTDAYDRLSTRLEQRFTRPEIERMMTQAGFEGVHFSNSEPFWCAVGIKST